MPLFVGRGFQPILDTPLQIRELCCLLLVMPFCMDFEGLLISTGRTTPPSLSRLQHHPEGLKVPLYEDPLVSKDEFTILICSESTQPTNNGFQPKNTANRSPFFSQPAKRGWLG